MFEKQRANWNSFTGEGVAGVEKNYINRPIRYIKRKKGEPEISLDNGTGGMLISRLYPPWPSIEGHVSTDITVALVVTYPLFWPVFNENLAIEPAPHFKFNKSWWLTVVVHCLWKE